MPFPNAMIKSLRQNEEVNYSVNNDFYSRNIMKLRTRPSETALNVLSECANEILDTRRDHFLVEYLKYHHQRLALDYEWLTQNVSSHSKILEIGGFPFFLSSALVRSGMSLEVIDLMSDLAAHVVDNKGIVVTPCDIEREPLPYDDGTFDEIVFNEVFEHLRINPIRTLREVFRVLRPGGRLWLSTPNMGSLKGIANLILKNEAWSVVGSGVFEQYAHIETHGWMGHVREYTSKEVSQFLKRIGFDISEIAYRGQYANPVANLISKPLPRFLPYFTCISSKPSIGR